MSDELTVVGKYKEIKEKASGWYEVEVDIGKQYPLRLATKRTSLLDAVRATKGATSTYTYKESESERINENTGKPYTNRYLEGVEVGGAAGSGSTAGGNAGGKENVDWDAKERRDFRSRSWAITISAFSHTIKPEDDPIMVYNSLKAFQQLLFEDICGDFGQTASAAAAVQTTIDEPPPSPDPEDDIPF